MQAPNSRGELTEQCDGWFSLPARSVSVSLSRDATQIDEENIGNTNTASTAPGPQHSPRHILKLDWTGMSPERAPRDVVWSVC